MSLLPLTVNSHEYHQPDPKVSVYNSHPNILSADIFAVSSNNLTYQVDDPSNTYYFPSNGDRIPLYVLFDITGYSSWDFGNVSFFNTTIDLGIQSITVSQAFLIVDGEVNPIRHVSINYPGFFITLTEGYHTISLIVLNFDKEKGIIYSFESIFIVVGENLPRFKRIPVTEFDLDYNIESWMTFPITVWNGKYWDRLDQIPLDSLSISFASLDISDNSTVDIYANIYIKGSIDLQFKEKDIIEHNGIAFFYDVSGLHPLDGLKSVDVRLGRNFMGIISFLPYGLWHNNLSSIDMPNSVADFEYLTMTMDSKVDSSFDFIASPLLQEFQINFIENVTITKSTYFFNLSAFLLPITYILRRIRRE